MNEPTSLLSLPHELRRRILLQTYVPTTAIKALHRCDSTGQYFRYSIYSEWFSTWRNLEEAFLKWAACLGAVDTRLEGDVKYVEGLWKEEHLNLLKAWKRGMGGDLDLALTDPSFTITLPILPRLIIPPPFPLKKKGYHVNTNNEQHYSTNDPIYMYNPPHTDPTATHIP
ncbi:hypothetical protein Vi05172_g2078 [Venturia inaequalis]|nr:hypothetical protein Vi05172_g2078 [Venturia inaequalis]